MLTEELRTERSGRLSDVQRRQVNILYCAVLSLHGMANDVVDLLIGADEFTRARPTVFSPRELLDDVRDFVQPIAEEKGLDLRVDAGGVERLIGHRLALGRVMLNLATNALRFTEVGYVELICRRAGASQIEFSVRDTGPGFGDMGTRQPDETVPIRDARARRWFSSSGLGLRVCRRLVEEMGSTLRVETRPQWGSRFVFELPALGSRVAVTGRAESA